MRERDIGKHAVSTVDPGGIGGRRLHPNPHLCAVYFLEGSHYVRSLSPAVRIEHKGKKWGVKRKHNCAKKDFVE